MLQVHEGRQQLMAMLAEDATWTLIGECAEVAAETPADGAAMEEKADPEAVQKTS